MRLPEFPQHSKTFVYVHTKCVTSNLHAGYVVTVDKRLMKDIHCKIHGELWPMEGSTSDNLYDVDVAGDNFGTCVIIQINIILGGQTDIRGVWCMLKILQPH